MKFNELSKELQEIWTRGVDHSVFNEDWAKMGAVVLHVKPKTRHRVQTIYFYKLKSIDNRSINLIGLTDDLGILSCHNENWHFDGFIQMATPSECAEAGIDYVPFMGWRDIESVPNDTLVLLKHESHGAVIGTRNPRFEAGTPCFFSEQVKTGYRQDVKNFDALAWMPLPLV